MTVPQPSFFIYTVAVVAVAVVASDAPLEPNGGYAVTELEQVLPTVRLLPVLT